MKKILGVERFFSARRCREMRGFLAASVYDDLSPKELDELSEHVNACRDCQLQAADLKKVAASIPVTTPELNFDLWPGLRREIRRSSRNARKGAHLQLSWRTALACGLCLVVAGGLFYETRRGHLATDGPVVAGQAAPLEGELAAVAALMEQRNYVAAYQRLDKALKNHSNSPLAGEAQLQLADLAYSRLNWYPEACEAYNCLFREHPQLFSARSECISRRELLDEARERDFAPLYALDAARRAGENTFARLESVVARYPDSLVAVLALEDMALQTLGEGAVRDGQSHVLALEQAKSRCTNSVAVARLQLEIGHIYVRELNDTAKARSFYAEVANFDNKALATLAQGSLAALEKPPSSDPVVMPASAR